MRFLGMRVSSDDLILGSGKFVNNLLKDVDKKVKHQFLGQDRLKQVEQFISEVCNKENINIKELKSGSRRGTISKIRSNLAISLVEEYGISFAETARHKVVHLASESRDTGVDPFFVRHLIV